MELARTDSGFRTLRGRVISGNDVRGRRRARGARHGRGTTSKERGGERERERRSGAEHDANFHAARALILIKYVRTRGHGEISGTKGNLYGDAVGFRDKNKGKKRKRRREKEGKEGEGKRRKSFSGGIPRPFRLSHPISPHPSSNHEPSLFLPVAPFYSLSLSLSPPLPLSTKRSGELISPRGEWDV